jgi:carbonic anhydrase
MNISGSSISGNCNNKCTYSFNYPDSSITAINNKNMIQLNYNKSPSSQVSFNSTTYNVTSFGILTPSSHKYNGVLADAEFFIQHSPVSSGGLLFVYIPISLNGNNGSGSDFVSQVIKAVSTTAPSSGESTTNGILEFSLNKLIPMTSYYSYTDDSKNNNIVFDLKNAIGIQNDTLSILNKVVKQWTTPASYGPSLFVNTNGPSFGADSGGNDINIDSQPTDASTEMIKLTREPVNLINMSFKSVTSNPFFIIVISLVILVLFFLGVQKSINYFHPKTN